MEGERWPPNKGRANEAAKWPAGFRLQGHPFPVEGVAQLDLGCPGMSLCPVCLDTSTRTLCPPSSSHPCTQVYPSLDSPRLSHTWPGKTSPQLTSRGCAAIPTRQARRPQAVGSPLTAMCKEPLCYPYLWGCSCLIGVRFTVSQVVHSKLVHSLLWIPREDPTPPPAGAGLRRAVCLFWLKL